MAVELNITSKVVEVLGSARKIPPIPKRHARAYDMPDGRLMLRDVRLKKSYIFNYPIDITGDSGTVTCSSVVLVNNMIDGESDYTILACLDGDLYDIDGNVITVSDS